MQGYLQVNYNFLFWVERATALIFHVQYDINDTLVCWVEDGELRHQILLHDWLRHL